MVKNLINTLLIFFMISSFAFAKKDNDTALKNEFGPDLTQVPYFLRFDYYKKYNVDWKYTYYADRKEFLLEYEKELATQKAQDKAEVKVELTKKKEFLAQKRAEQKKLQDRLKAELAEEKSEKNADKERRKAFEDIIKQQRKELQDMAQQMEEQRLASQRNR